MLSRKSIRPPQRVISGRVIVLPLQEVAPPHLNKSLLLLCICALSLLQFIPLLLGVSVRTDLVIAGLSNVNVISSAGFCLGFICLIIIDLFVDIVFMGTYELWVSRTLYFLITLIYSMLAIYGPSIHNIGVFYHLFGNLAFVFFTGRAFLDLCMNDTTHTWTMKRTLTLLSSVSGILLLTSFSLNDKNQPKRTKDLLITAFTTALIYISLLTYNWIKGFKLILAKHIESSFWNVVHKCSHEDAIVLLISSSLTFFTMLIIILNIAFTIGTDTAAIWSPSYLFCDLIIRVFFVISIALLPSAIQKHRTIVLQSDLNLKSMFVKNVSHEIRTPLNIAVVGLDILKRRIQKGDTINAREDTLEMIDEIMDSCKVAVTILDDLLAYEKISSGAFKMDKADVKIFGLISDCAALFNIQARGKDINFSVLQNMNVISDATIVFADYGKITQVLRNFISNALKFTPDSGVVRIVAFEFEDNVMIQVIDSGAGMTPAQVEMIFKEIVQFDVNVLQAGGGSGIGLWVCKKVVDIHGGRVKARSGGKGLGCVFELMLPIKRYYALDGIEADKPLLQIGPGTSLRVHPDPTPLSVIKHNQIIGRHSRNSIAGSVQLTRDPLSGLRALVVDDSKLNRKFLKRLLAQGCANVDEVDDGSTCLEFIKDISIDERIDFILMDKHMPKMDGLTATRGLRAAGYSGIIVGLTGDAGEDDCSAFLKSGADDCLIKPVTYAELSECIGQLLDSRLSTANRP